MPGTVAHSGEQCDDDGSEEREERKTGKKIEIYVSIFDMFFIYRRWPQGWASGEKLQFFNNPDLL